MFYRIIDKHTIEKAPRPLKIDGKDVFTNDEVIYNSQGYYKLEREEYPDDGREYIPYYELEDNIIIQKWEFVVEDEPLSEYLDNIQEAE